MKKIAVVLFNLGGPDKLEDVEPFLFNLFYDKAIIPFVKPLRWLFAKIISSTRKKKSQNIYRQIGGGSPLLKLTIDQAKALEESLNKSKTVEYRVFTSMRYWKPFSTDAVKKIKKYDPEEVILLPLYYFIF